MQLNEFYDNGRNRKLNESANLDEVTRRDMPDMNAGWRLGPPRKMNPVLAGERVDRFAERYLRVQGRYAKGDAEELARVHAQYDQLRTLAELLKANKLKAAKAHWADMKDMEEFDIDPGFPVTVIDILESAGLAEAERTPELVSAADALADYAESKLLSQKGNSISDLDGPASRAYDRLHRIIEMLMGGDVAGAQEYWNKLVQRKLVNPQEIPAEALQVLDAVQVNEADDKKCPPATQDLELNLANRQKAIEKYGYGPMNPNIPNEKFWQKKADMWQLDDPEEAKQSVCGNCAAFDVTSKTIDCITMGIGTDGNSEDPMDVVDAGDLGYCRFLKFKCASARTCDAWVVGGPITDDKELEEGNPISKQKRKEVDRTVGKNWVATGIVKGADAKFYDNPLRAGRSVNRFANSKTYKDIHKGTFVNEGNPHTPPEGMSAREYAQHEFGRKGEPKLRVGATVRTPRASGKVKDIYTKELASTGKTAQFMTVVDRMGKEHEVRVRDVTVLEGYTVLPKIDAERYGPREGMEGPFTARNGMVVYYDPKEGKYYDPNSDFYIDHDDWHLMNSVGEQTVNEYEIGQAEDGKYYDDEGNEVKRITKANARHVMNPGAYERPRASYPRNGKRFDTGPWYILINGKPFKGRDGAPAVFTSEKHAHSVAAKLKQKDFNKGKVFSLSQSLTDSQQTVNEISPELRKSYLAKAPKSVWALADKGQELKKQGDEEGSMKYFDKATDRMSRLNRIHNQDLERHRQKTGATMHFALMDDDKPEYPFICVHARKGTCNVTAKTSYEAVQKAAAKWKMKTTAGIDAYRADITHTPRD